MDGLISRLTTGKDSIVHHAILTALCRLHDQETEWTGDWWGTRPDTRGPYYHPAKWEETDKIGQALHTALAGASGEDAPFLVGELKRHRIDMPEATALMLKLASEDPGFRAQAVNLLMDNSAIPPEALPIVEKAASSPQGDAALCAKSLRRLQRSAGSPTGFDTLTRTLIAIRGESNLPPEVAAAAVDCEHDGENARRVDRFTTLAGSTDPAARELAYAVLLTVSESHQAPKEARAAASQSVEAAWKSADSSASLLRAIGQTRRPEYDLQVRAKMKDENAAVRTAAEYAAAQLHLGQADAPSQPTVHTMKYEDVVAAAAREPGDAALGSQLFQRQGCIACHTTSSNQPPKGPLLADISSRYSRPEILESILKPSAKIAQGFTTNFFKLKNNTVLQGFVVREGGDEIEIRDITGVSTTIQKNEIVRRGTLQTSIMPEGLADNLTLHDLSSILAYLETLKGKK